MAHFKLLFVLALFVFGSILADADLKDVVNKLPEDLQVKIDERQIAEWRNMSNNAFQEQCEKNGGPGFFEKAQEALEDFGKCFESQLNLTKLGLEVAQYKPTGKIDELFKGYCAKLPKIQACVGFFLNITKSCFESEQREGIRVMSIVADKLGEFVCRKDGEQIALFIAEGGPECFNQKGKELQECAQIFLRSDDSIYINYVRGTLSGIKFNEKHCAEITDLQICVVNALKGCENPSTANIIESLLKYLRKSTPCNKYPGPNSATGLAVTSITILMAFSTFLLK